MFTLQCQFGRLFVQLGFQSGHSELKFIAVRRKTVDGGFDGLDARVSRLQVEGLRVKLAFESRRRVSGVDRLSPVSTKNTYRPWCSI